MATATKEVAKKVVEASEPKVDPPLASGPAHHHPSTPEKMETTPAKDVVEEKAVIPHPQEKVDEPTKALAVVEKTADPSEKKSTKGSFDRDVALAQVENEKRLSFIKAWEESEKSKVENKAQKKISEVAAWENSKKASVEARLKKIEEELERKKAEYAEKMKNKIALVQKEADEKRAMVVAKRQEDILKAEEMAAKYRATNQTPKKGFGCLG